jgi:hypothetical protein
MKSKRGQSPKATLQEIRDLEAEWSFYQVPKDQLQACLEWEFWREAYNLNDMVKEVVFNLRAGRAKSEQEVFFTRMEASTPLETLACYSEDVWPQKPFLSEDQTVRLRAWIFQSQLREARATQEKNRPQERYQQVNDFQQSLHWFCQSEFLHKTCPCSDFLGDQCECRVILPDWRKLPSGKTVVASNFFKKDSKFGCVTAALRINLVQRDTAIVEDFKQWLKQLRDEVAPLAGFRTGPSEVGKAEKVDYRMRLLKGLAAIRLQRKIGSFEKILEAFSLSDCVNHLFEAGGLPANNHKSWRGFVRDADAFICNLLDGVTPKDSILKRIKFGGG